MRRYAAMIVALLIVGLLAGCSKTKPVGQAVTPPAVKKPAGNAGIFAELTQKRARLKSYVQVMDMGGRQAKHAMKLENGKPVAMKMQMAPGGGWILVLMDEKVQYTYDPNSKTAMKMSMGDSQPEQGKAPAGLKVPKLEDMKTPTMSSDTVDGVDCWKIVSPSLGGDNSAVWMDKEYGLARQMQTGQTITKIQYEQINAVPDSEFQLPPGTKVQDMGAMMHQMPKMPQGMPKGMPPGMPMPPGH